MIHFFLCVFMKVLMESALFLFIWITKYPHYFTLNASLLCLNGKTLRWKECFQVYACPFLHVHVFRLCACSASFTYNLVCVSSL